MHYSSGILVTLALLVTGAGAVPWISEVYPDTWMKGDEDEYLTISWDTNPGEISISDGEGTISLVPADNQEHSCTIARNGEAYRRTWGKSPAYELIDSSAMIPEPRLTGKFQLSNKKDELVLSWHNTPIQNISWPGTFACRQGQIHLRSPHGGWDDRVLMAGGSRFAPVTYPNVSGTAFVSPDCSRGILEETIREADTEILLNVYEFTDTGLAQELCDAAGRGVRVSVLLEGGPVGGIPPEEFPVIDQLVKTGISVRIMEGSDGDHVPYRYDHAKYLVVDGRDLLVTTENFKEHSFPHIGESGNRGWGVILHSSDLAGYFSRVFREDENGPGVNLAEGRPGDTESPVMETYHPVFVSQAFQGAEVTPVLSPDTSTLIADMINRSRERVWIQQAYITEYPNGRENPFLAAAVNAARRGVDVRILLDGYYYNIEGEKDNDEMVTSLSTLAARENIPLQARVLYPEKTGLLKVHTKGVITDGEVLVSSMNWNENSACFNREAGVIIKSLPAASYFASVFLSDWSGDMPDQQVQVPGTDGQDGMIRMAALAAVLILLVILYRRYHR